VSEKEKTWDDCVERQRERRKLGMIVLRDREKEENLG
jgi:hypothetical protein